LGGNPAGATYTPAEQVGTTARFITIDEVRDVARQMERETGPTSAQLLDQHHQWQESRFPADQRVSSPWRTAELHDEPEPALPSTTGDSDVDDDALAAAGFGGDDTDVEQPVPGLDTNRAAPWGFPESAADHPNPQVAQPAESDQAPQADEQPGTLLQSEGMIHAPAHVPEEVAMAAQFNPALADFTQTAGFRALAVDAGAGADQGMGVADGGPPNDSDIAKAAQALLQKTSMKNFSFAEQQELIAEGGGKARARNFNDLKIAGTHYEQLGDAAPSEDEFLLL
jgi:hypothetical protein